PVRVEGVLAGPAGQADLQAAPAPPGEAGPCLGRAGGTRRPAGCQQTTRSRHRRGRRDPTQELTPSELTTRTGLTHGSLPPRYSGEYSDEECVQVTFWRRFAVLNPIRCGARATRWRCRAAA